MTSSLLSCNDVLSNDQCITATVCTLPSFTNTDNHLSTFNGALSIVFVYTHNITELTYVDSSTFTFNCVLLILVHHAPASDCEVC